MANPAPRRTGKAIHQPPHDDLAATREKERRAVELAIAGMNLDQIAHEVGYADKSGAWRAIRRTLDRQEAAAVTELRALENARLDRLQTVLWPPAMRGDLKAIDRLLRLFERRAKLNGLDQQGARDAGALAEALLSDPDARRERLTLLRDQLAEARREAEAAGE
jgi:hypothetical protein